MTENLKRRAEIREKIQALRTESTEVLAAVRDSKQTVDGAVRSKLEQISINLQTEETALDAVNIEIDGRALAKDIDQRFSALEGQGSAPAGSNHSMEGDDSPLGLIAPLGRNLRHNFRALRNSHEAFRPWAASGDFFRSIARFAINGNRDPDERLGAFLEARAPTAFGELIDSDGGFLVPPQFMAEMLQIEHSGGQLLSRVRVIPMESRKVTFPAIAETSRADGSRLGGVRSFWEGEGDTPAITKAKYKEVSLEVSKLTAITVVSDRLLEDAPALGAWLQFAYGSEQTFKKEAAIIDGTGAGQPEGINQSDAVVVVAKESGQTALTIVAQNIIKMRARLHARSRQNAVWIINQDCEPELSTLSLAVGAGGAALPAWLPAGGMLNGANDTLFGKAVIPIEQAETLGTQGDIALYDLTQYLFGQRGGLESADSIHVRFDQGERTFRFTEWVDGGSWWNSSLTPYRGTATQSPFIQLAVRA